MFKRTTRTCVYAMYNSQTFSQGWKDLQHMFSCDISDLIDLLYV